jgi:hypothetical protein
MAGIRLAAIVCLGFLVSAGRAEQPLHLEVRLVDLSGLPVETARVGIRSTFGAPRSTRPRIAVEV